MRNRNSKPNSKETKIRKHLLAHKSLTPLQALTNFGHMRLADVVYDLRREGYRIENIGDPGKHAKYYRPLPELKRK